MALFNVDDVERAAAALTDKMTWDFWAGGATDLLTVAENKHAYLDYRIRPRYLRDVEAVNILPRVNLFGKSYAVPVGFAPSSMHRLAHPDGELATGAAAQARNWPMAISSYSTASLEDVRVTAPDALVFFQLYVFKNRDTSLDLVRRAEAAGFKAVLLTVDSPYLGLRFSERKNKFSLPAGVEPGNFSGGRYAGPIDFSVEAKSKSKGPGKNDDLTKEVKPNVIDPALSYADIKWLKSVTKMEVWVKGILTAEDAAMAVDAGADGIWVSNHGGRQLDGVLPTLHALPEVVAAVKGRIPVHMDGGIRRGSDIFRALALGADFVWIGRPVLWGLKLDGQKGVELVQQFLEDEFRLTLALAGCTDTTQIAKEHLARRNTATVWSKL
ncbi:FMN-dependent dehydrogenase [Limtongia smithiae]|uniref:FMN-dependent dehydrogenase n=1 Tax=Limtongia smithiae TaxID=1125753 RepID=UPI0034CF0431